MEFTIGEQHYRTAKLDTFRQFHVSRKLLPVLSGLFGKAGMAGAEGQVDVTSIIEGVSTTLAGMPDADCEYVLQACLAVTARQQGNAWARVWDSNSRTLMFDDIDMSVMLQITVKVVQESLGNFFHELQEKQGILPTP